MFSAISFAVFCASKSDIVAAFTKTLTSLPALIAYAFVTHGNEATNASIS
jgi:hypothetical protein